MGFIGDILNLSITTKSQNEFIQELNKRKATKLAAIPTHIEKYIEKYQGEIRDIKVMYISRIHGRRIYFTEYYKHITFDTDEDKQRFRYTVIKHLQQIAEKVSSLKGNYVIGTLFKNQIYIDPSGTTNRCNEFVEKYSEMEPFEPVKKENIKMR